MKCLAGVVGFEPTVHDTKNRCLTTWPHPSNVWVFSARRLVLQAQNRAFLQLVLISCASYCQRMEKFDVVIVGAGAAGMMCAIEAGRRGRSVLLIDHAKRAGEKIRISGGGRCNFTNLNISRERFLSQNQHFALSCLSRYTQWDFIDLIASHNIPYHEKTLGQLFCDNSAGDILAMLDTEMKASGVKVWLGS